jgi:CCR4-NOT transcription complex subunit 6
MPQTSRQSASPHHRARSAAIASRMTNTKAAITILDPSTRPSANGVPHRKTTSLSVTQDAASPPEDIDGTPLHPSSTTAPAASDDSGPSQPWTGLDLGGIRLKTLSPALFAFDHITNLFINHNNLTSLSPAIAKLKHLTVLDATGNQLTSVPPELGMLTRLKELLLFDNALTDLPQQLGSLHQLETLGIDGNPLDERLRKIIQDEGTQGLIITLRESCPIGPEPPERQWLEIEPPHIAENEEDRQESFTLLCYNILCERYATAATYGYTPGWALDWNYRKAAILQEVVNASADLVCLQEVDGEQYAEFFQPKLKAAGYSGAYNPKTRARTMNSDEKKLVDGCATFWKDSK